MRRREVDGPLMRGGFVASGMGGSGVGVGGGSVGSWAPSSSAAATGGDGAQPVPVAARHGVTTITKNGAELPPTAFRNGETVVDDAGLTWTCERKPHNHMWIRIETLKLDTREAPVDGPTHNVAADPAYDAGRVDFSEMLTTDAQWSLKAQFDELLGRPYLSVQLAAMLPADVALRLSRRIAGTIEDRVRRELDHLHEEINAATTDTLARLAAQTDGKLKELRRERFTGHSRLS